MPDRPPDRNRPSSAFTLVELLVVIAIISLLAAMLLPVLSQARKTANLSSCLSNQHQVFLSLTVYANHYAEWPTNETPAMNWWYYRYRTRGANGMRWVIQAEGAAGWKNRALACPGALPGDSGLLGTIPADGKTWCWTARRSFSDTSENWDENAVPNRWRGWYAYHGPLRYYEDGGNISCTTVDVVSNAWDCFGDGWRWNNSLSAKPPISRRSPQNSPVFFKNTDRRVIVYCPNVECTYSGSVWWTSWTAPHMHQPRWDNVTTEPPLDARNYLFNDGHALSIVR
jgi:prepilin-type N-terminal cleavage/methylation domain-containing protein